MKAFVTGATGFIGSHLVDELLHQGFEVICLVRKTSNLRWLEGKNVTLIVANLSETYKYDKILEDVDYVFHVAGVTFAKNKDNFYTGNYHDTKFLLETVKTYTHKLKRFVFISSQTVSGPADSLTKPKEEDDICNPLTTYAKSKKLAEEEVIKFKNEFPITVLRVSAVFGPRDTAILAVFKSVKMGLATIVGLKQEKYLNLIYINDLVLGVVKASKANQSIGQIYFLASEDIYTWDELIPMIAKKLEKKFYLKIRFPHFLVLMTAAFSEFCNKFSNRPSVFNFEKGIDFIQNYWICSVKKAKNDFAFEQKTSIKDGINNTIDWYKKNKWL